MSASHLLHLCLRLRRLHHGPRYRCVSTAASTPFASRTWIYSRTRISGSRNKSNTSAYLAVQYIRSLTPASRPQLQLHQNNDHLVSSYKQPLRFFHTSQPKPFESTSQRSELDLPSLDRKWQAKWHAERGGSLKQTAINATGSERKAYILPMFPYPSGNLHMGHLRVYTIADVLSRWKRMSGFDVLNPMGWDAFGLPAENAAIERGVDPSGWTYENIGKMKQLLKAMNTDFQWENELSTCDPGFYKHTQKLFLLLWRHGLAYQADGKVNWDPIDKTVLANEQVDGDGRSWRSGAKVEQRLLKQWYLKVTDFKEHLLEDLDLLSESQRWPQRVIAMQRNWIGRSKGVKFRFMVGKSDGSPFDRRPIEVFTTRPDTLLGVQFLALSPSHPLVTEMARGDERLQNFVAEALTAPSDSKMGYRLSDINGINPAALLYGASQHDSFAIPVFVAPYVLSDYGEGALMGVPGHDDRDFAFWQMNSPQSPAKFVIVARHSDGCGTDRAHTERGQLSKECGIYAGLTSENAGNRFLDELSKSGVATYAETWRLRDWLISRQRYWGTPIPIIHCNSCGTVPVPDEQLPVVLPKLSGNWFLTKRGNPLEHINEWFNVSCPECGQAAKRDTDTMDTFVDSAWYYFRFPDPNNASEPFSTESVDSNLPVDVYIGGIEHAILHLLYARFIAKFLANINMWPKGQDPNVRGEPFQTLISQGMVHGKTFSDPVSDRFLLPHELDLSEPDNPRIIASNQAPKITFQKMSKSKHNGVDPVDSMERFGSDVVRAHVLFAAPVTDVLEWDETKVAGIQRWLQKTWRHVRGLNSAARALPSNVLQNIEGSLDFESLSDAEMASWNNTQEHLRNIVKSYEVISLNVLISELMKLTHEVHQFHENTIFSLHLMRQILCAMAPVTPAFAEECWSLLHTGPFCKQEGSPVEPSSIFEQHFPVPDLEIRRQVALQPCAVQENGKLRFVVNVPIMPASLVIDIEGWALTSLRGTREGAEWLHGKASTRWKRIVVAKGGRIINFVK